MGNSESLQVKDKGLSYNGQRVSRRWEDDYVDISPEMEAFSKEQMEDQFIKIVVCRVGSGSTRYWYMV
jgi:hypothetical protein